MPERDLSKYNDQHLHDLRRELDLKINAAEQRGQRIVEKVKAIRSERFHVIQELDRRRYPEEPPIGSVIKFTRKLGRTDYVYAAVRVDRYWYTTSQIDHASKALMWKALIDYVRTQDTHGRMSTRISVLTEGIQALTLEVGFDK